MMADNGFLIAILTDSTLLAMWGAVLLHWILPIPSELHPLRLVQRIAINLHHKVHRKDSSPAQQQLNGLLALGFLVLTPSLFLIALAQFSLSTTLFNLTLLWFVLDWRYPLMLSQRLYQGLEGQRLAYCRHLLSQVLRRDTGALSSPEIGRAAAETVLIGTGRTMVGVLFWFMVGGGVGAVMYRLLVTLAHSWSPNRPAFIHFGLPAIRLLAVADIVPMRLFALLLSVGRGGSSALRLLWQQGERWPLPGPGWLLVATGGKLAMAQGGSAYYQQQQRIRPILGGALAPTALHLKQLHQLLVIRTWLWLICLSVWMIGY